MPNDKQAPKELKVTDKRIFTAEGDIREEFQKEIRPAEPQPAQAPAAPAEPARPEPPKPQDARAGEERRRSTGEPAAPPATPFVNFLLPLIEQAYMFLGLLHDPRITKPIYEPQAARQTIDILTLLREKTSGNLTPEEEDFFDTHLGELKLAYVQRTKSI